MELNRVIDSLKEKGYRLTPQRVEILKIVLEKLEKGEHPTTNDIFVDVRTKMPNVSVSTVYNILRLLENNGIIASFEYDGTHYDKTEPHIDVICTNTSKIFDLDDKEIINALINKNIKPTTILVKGVCS
ncbi:MAG: transcriptional repressor [Thermoproteus sp.]|nr:transcriptional repressor [Thermoproteus sp.]